MSYNYDNQNQQYGAGGGQYGGGQYDQYNYGQGNNYQQQDNQGYQQNNYGGYDYSQNQYYDQNNGQYNANDYGNQNNGYNAYDYGNQGNYYNDQNAYAYNNDDNYQQYYQQPSHQEMPAIPPPQQPSSGQTASGANPYLYQRQDPAELAADLHVAMQLDSEMNKDIKRGPNPQGHRQNMSRDNYPSGYSVDAPRQPQRGPRQSDSRQKNNQYAQLGDQAQKLAQEAKQKLDAAIQNRMQNRAQQQMDQVIPGSGAFLNQNQMNRPSNPQGGRHQNYYPAPGGHPDPYNQEPLLRNPAPENDPNHILEENSSFLLPLIKCEPKQSAFVFLANLLLNPLGTFLAACFDERGFNHKVLIIALLQLLIYWLLSKLSFIGTILNLPNWMFGMFLGCRIGYYNFKAGQQERQIGRQN